MRRERTKDIDTRKCASSHRTGVTECAAENDYDGPEQHPRRRKTKYRRVTMIQYGKCSARKIMHWIGLDFIGNTKQQIYCIDVEGYQSFRIQSQICFRVRATHSPNTTAHCVCGVLCLPRAPFHILPYVCISFRLFAICMIWKQNLLASHLGARHSSTSHFWFKFVSRASRGHCPSLKIYRAAGRIMTL